MQIQVVEFFFIITYFFFVVTSPIKAEIINKISIDGNKRITSSETIQIKEPFGVSLNDDLFDNDLNEILKKLYNTNFFENVSVKVKNNTLFN